jgi:hypothetical protein
MTWNYLTCGKFSYLTFVFNCFANIGHYLRFTSVLITGGTNAVYNSDPKYSSVMTFSS